MKFSKLAIVSALAVVSSLSVVSPAESRTMLGGLNLDRACFKQTLVAYVKAVVLNSRDVYSWKCRVYPTPILNGPHLYETGIDLSRACREQYGRGAYAEFSNREDAYSWRCYRN